MKKLTLSESIMSDLDALAREHSELGLFICDALNEDDFNLEKDKDTIEFLIDVFENAHKDLDMAPMQVTEKKATYCGRCGHTHVKGTPCPRPFKEGLSIYGDDAYFVVPNKGKMKKEDILKAIKEVLAEGTVEINTTDGTEKSATPEQRQQIKNARRAGASISYRKKGDLGEDIDLGHEDDEPHMIKSELYKVAKYALELYKMVDQFEGKGEVDFPAWWQSKVTKATSMISSAKHYLEFELTEPAMDQAVVGTDEPMNEGRPHLEVGDKVKASKEYGGLSGEVVDIKGSFVVVKTKKGTKSYHESDLNKEGEKALGEVGAEYRPKRPAPKVGDTVGNTVQGFNFTVVGIHGDKMEVEDEKTLIRFMTDIDNMYVPSTNEAKKKLDPVGKEDKDINNDGKVDKTDKYLKNKRVKIGQAIASHKK
jgi:hypothetical protein